MHKLKAVNGFSFPGEQHTGEASGKMIEYVTFNKEKSHQTAEFTRLALPCLDIRRLRPNLIETFA